MKIASKLIVSNSLSIFGSAHLQRDLHTIENFTGSKLTASSFIFLTLNLSLWLATIGRRDSVATFSPVKPPVTVKKEVRTDANFPDDSVLIIGPF